MACGVVETPEVMVTDQLIPIQELDRVRNAVCLLRSDNMDESELWSGTGFYVNVKIKNQTKEWNEHGIMTNYHVYGEKVTHGGKMVAVFHHEGTEKKPFKISLEPFNLVAFCEEAELDYVLIKLDKNAMDHLEYIGVKPILVDSSKLPTANERSTVYIFQHPEGKEKHFSQDTIRCVKPPYIEYFANTLQGSSGSPVMVFKESTLQLVALHSKGVTSSQKKFNKGVLVSEILYHLDTGKVRATCISLPLCVPVQMETNVKVPDQTVNSSQDADTHFSSTKKMDELEIESQSYISQDQTVRRSQPADTHFSSTKKMDELETESQSYLLQDQTVSRSQPADTHLISANQPTDSSISSARQVDKKPLTDQSDSPQGRAYLDLLKDLNLQPNVKLTIADARRVDRFTLKDDQLTSPDQIPNYILRTLMITNHHAREFKLGYLGTDRNDNIESDSDDSDDESGINPMDALLAIFHCSDNFLRRDIAAKLSACQLSLPFLLPDPMAPSVNVTALLLALQSIKKTWKSSNGVQEVFATEHPFPVVSFIRIGKVTVSKSSLINGVMGGGDVFFHKDMKGGNFERKIVGGLVELSWYLPGGSEEQIVENEVCFANLRGDGSRFTKQLHILSKISSIMYLLLPSEQPDTDRKDILNRIMNSKAQITLIFGEKITNNTKKYFDDLKRRSRGKVFLMKKARKNNKYEFEQSIRQNIQKNLFRAKATPLVELAAFASECEIHLDNDQSYSNNFEERVHNWLKLGSKGAKEMMKLQSHIPRMADLEREIYCPKRKSIQTKRGRIERDTNEIHADMEKEKKNQKMSLDAMHQTIIQTLDDIVEMNDLQRNNVLTRLKQKLDKMSLQIMATFHQEYQVASENLRTRKVETLEKAKEPSSEEEKLKDLEESISKCSFGLEHIMREIAQLYQISEKKIDYAAAAAEVLLSGHPLELVDGDSSYVPLQWFKAVYTKLQHKTNDAKIFVISVLGIQSSGKSTMLNTMFGLEFAVSAGRCTRGAFASLIPVSDSVKSESNFVYILVIDTEGLRGSGDPQLREHDNELATFAVAVADITIVNIFGESHNEMKEFLEIAVAAFLKMKLVKEKKACKIVHQNVADPDASRKLAVERTKLKKDLDYMTKVSATQNREDNIQKFNDIISFDENMDVFYIPSFFLGSPPMAPVNPKYGRAIQQVKQEIISLMCRSSSQNAISQFRERVCNLRKAMLKEDFIFSFRNTIELRAHRSLDQKYFKEFVEVMVTGMAELERKVQLALRRSTNRQERLNIWSNSEIQIREKAKVLQKKMEKAMENFFETDVDKATLEQWRESVMIRIGEQQKNQVEETTKTCQATFEHCQNRQDVEEKKQDYEQIFLQKAREFITSHHDMTNPSRCEVEFNQVWKEWIKDVPYCQELKINVNNEMVYVLSNTEPHLNVDIREKLDQKGRSIIEFKEIAPVIDLHQLCIRLTTKLRNVFHQEQHQQQCVSSAKVIKDQVVNAATNFANATSKLDMRCRRNDLIQMYHLVIDKIEEETNALPFKFGNNIKCDILLYVFGSVFKIFDKMEERYIQQRDIREDLERNFRPRLENYFLNLCSKMKNDMLAAFSIVDVLKRPIKSELSRTMGPAVAKELLKNSEFQSKGSFHANALIELGEKGNFESYVPYLVNPIEFLRKKLSESIENFCLMHGNVNSLLDKEAKQIQDTVLTAISTANNLVESGERKLTFWIQRFVEACSTLEITKEMFVVATIDDNLQDISVFEGKLRENVVQFIQSLVDLGVDSTVMEEWNPSPHDHLFSSMFGCQSFCPLCKGLCDHTVQNHAGSHCTRIHRPICLKSYRYINSGVLSIQICTTLVASNEKFKNVDTSQELHPFKEYKSVNDYYKSWSIPADSSFEASNYWQWFIATFSKELTKHYNAKEPEIPFAWKLLTLKDVKEQLRQDYKL